MASKKKDMGHAIAVGEAMARRVRRRRGAAKVRRSKAISKVRRPVIRASAVGPKGMLAKGPTTHVSAGVLVAEGDSWFDYPFHDVLSELEDGYGYDVESVAHKGDTVEGMAYSDGQLTDFSRCIEKVLRSGVRPKAILLSGGGNDVAGEEFPVLLNHAMAETPGLNADVLAGVIDQRLREAYVTILTAVTRVCEQQIGEPVRILVHGYDYPIADGRGFWGGWGPLPGPWLEPGFRKKGYARAVKRDHICVELIDRFNQMLSGIAGKAPFAHVKHVDLRNTLSRSRANDAYKKWWANELHPTKKGFEAVTSKFASMI